VRTGKTLRKRLEELDVPARNQFLRAAGVRAVAHKTDMPPLEMDFASGGDMTGLDIPRSVSIHHDQGKRHAGGRAVECGVNGRFRYMRDR